MKFFSGLGRFGLLLIVAGCVSAPRETIQLAEIVDTQVGAMQGSHEEFVRLYYSKLRDEVDEFMEHRWIPNFLARVVSGEQAGGAAFRSELDLAYKLSTLDWEQVVQIQGVEDTEVRDAIRRALAEETNRQGASLGRVLMDFATASQREINRQRAALMVPIDEQEAFVLNELRKGYADIQRGNAATRAYLASVADLVEERDIVLEKLNLLGTQRRIVETALKASDGAADALGLANSADQGVADFLGVLEAAKAELRELGGSSGSVGESGPTGNDENNPGG